MVKGISARSAKWIGLTLVLVFAGVSAWRQSDVSVAWSSVKRLRLVWPNISVLSPQDRELLSILAVQCDLPNKPETKAAVIACLKEAAASGRFQLPAGVTDAQRALDVLLTRSPPRDAS